MAVDTVHYLHGVSLAGVYLDQITSANFAMGNEYLLVRSSGDPRVFMRSRRAAKPSLRFSTPQIATTLASIGQYGANLSGGNCDLYFRKGTDLGTRQNITASEHQRWRGAQCYGFWSTIRATHQGDASIDVELIPTWNGSANPFVQTGGVPLTGLLPTGDELFTLGPIFIDGDEVPGTQDVSISTGIAPSRRGSGGEMFDTFAGCKTVDPIVTISGLDIPNVWGFGTDGSPLTELVVYLRAKGEGGSLADDVAAHVKIVATAGMVYPESADGSLEDEAMSGLRIELATAGYQYDALTISTGAVIE